MQIFYDVDTDLLELFRESEITDEKKTESADATIKNQDDRVPALFAAAPAHVIRDRLDIMGFTMSTVQEAFASGIELLRTSGSMDELLTGYSFSKWQSLLAEYRNFDSTHDDNQLSELALAFLCHTETNRGFPQVDPRYHLRAVIESASPEELVEYDFTDLRRGGLLESIEANAAAPYVRIDRSVLPCTPDLKMLVLTEGSSDARILDAALGLFYPHLKEFVSFMDFGASRAAGGATALVTTLKTFGAARIAHRAVAVFDNDAAASDALRSMRLASLPDNLRWMQLPAIEFAASYPAISPSGRREMVDVNGMAGGIEIYFGPSVLRSIDGELPAVRWSGYVDGVKKYQGEIVGKERYHEHFFAEISRLQTEGTRRHDNLRDMRLVVDTLLGTFR